RTEFEIGALEAATPAGMQQEVVEKLGLDPALVNGHHRPSPGEFLLFLPNGGEVRLDTATGRGGITEVETRFVIFESNVLHLNHLKGIWTWVADAYALLLLGMAITGIIILKGRKGLGGRGKWFVAGGVMLPLVFVVYYYGSR
ncbi:MAG: PepSY-associated TM helix domain-containing protein, partial [Planctomycetota bacterium]|nr:PepSY-associated TM helix domain-containing protein [Planctomycetota bacterium]